MNHQNALHDDYNQGTFNSHSSYVCLGQSRSQDGVSERSGNYINQQYSGHGDQQSFQPGQILITMKGGIAKIKCNILHTLILIYGSSTSLLQSPVTNLCESCLMSLLSSYDNMQLLLSVSYVAN